MTLGAAIFIAIGIVINFIDARKRAQAASESSKIMPEVPNHKELDQSSIRDSSIDQGLTRNDSSLRNLRKFDS